MANAARVGDMHQCPAVTGTVPHVGGPITGPGASTVMIENKPAALADDACTCTGPASTIQSGSSSVTIENKAAARQGDPTAHGGSIQSGSSSVQIG